MTDSESSTSLPSKGEVVSYREIERLCLQHGYFELWSRISSSRKIKDVFKSDGCTMWPDRFFKGSYYNICFFHDLEYWCGGSKEERKIADKRLSRLFRERGMVILSVVMYVGVRVGGCPYIPSPWRWTLHDQ